MARPRYFLPLFPPDVAPPVNSIKSLFTVPPASVIKMVNKTQARSWLCWRALPTPTPGSDLVSLGPWTWSVSPTETAFSAQHRRSVNVHWAMRLNSSTLKLPLLLNCIRIPKPGLGLGSILHRTRAKDRIPNQSKITKMPETHEDSRKQHVSVVKWVPKT